MLGLKVTRTANAGVLLELDGKRILLDGVCEALPPYLGTPTNIRNSLIENMPDVLAFTHEHLDHYDCAYAEIYKEKTLRSVLGPESLNFYEIGNGINISAVETRHIGKTDVKHVSFVISGSKTVWFMGDSTPLALRKFSNFPKPDVLIVPFAYVITPSSWRVTKETGAKKVILLHMPPIKEDKEGLWDMLKNTVDNDDLLLTLDIGGEFKI